MENTFALVGTANPMAATKHVRVERAFFIAGQPQKVGSVVEVSAQFAAELVATLKAVVVDPPAPVVPVVVEDEKPQTRKVKKDVRE
jgi:hypothetical protein